MTIERAKKLLSEENIQAEEKEVFKNGVTLTGLAIKLDGNISPTIYPENMNTDEDDFIEEVKRIIAETPDINVTDKITDKEFLDYNLALLLQKRSAVDYLKRDYLDLEVVPYINIDLGNGDGVVKITNQLLSSLPYDSDEIFDIATNNTKNKIKMETMGEKLGTPEMDASLAMHVVSNHESVYGSIALYFPEILENYITEKGIKDAIILPSSIHEIIITPRMEQSDDAINAMIHEVNTTQVAPEEVLSDHYYYIVDGKIEY